MTQHEIDEVKWYASDDSSDWDVSEVRSLLAHIDALEERLRGARGAALVAVETTLLNRMQVAFGERRLGLEDALGTVLAMKVTP